MKSSKKSSKKKPSKKSSQKLPNKANFIYPVRNFIFSNGVKAGLTPLEASPDETSGLPKLRFGLLTGLTVLISVLVIFTVVEAAPRLIPYSPGETLDPSCSPNETNCTVSGPITSLGEQTGTTQTFATSSDTNIGLTITSVGDVHTFVSQWLETLGISRGGTGATSFGQGWIYSDGGTNILAASTSPTVAWLTATSTTATTTLAGGLSVAGSSGLTVLQNGNVGIGTTSPYSRLSVWGSGTGATTMAEFTNSASTSVMAILNNGNVGIGTASPSQALTVNGSVFSTQIYKDVFAWGSNSAWQAQLALGSSHGGFGSSVSPGRSFTATSSWSAFDAGDNGVGIDPDGYEGAVFDGRYIYFIPSDNGTNFHGEVLRYDTTGSFTSVSSWTAYDPGANGVGVDADGYAGGVFDGRYVYFVPLYNGTVRNGEVLRYDTTGSFTSVSSWTAYDPGANGVGVDPNGFNGAIFDGRYVYFVPWYDAGYHGQVLRYDTSGNFTSTGSWAAFDPSSTGGAFTNAKGLVGGVFDGRYIYFIQHGYSLTLRYDTNESFTDINSWTTYDTTLNGFSGAVFDGRFIYLGPNTQGKALRYDTTGSFTSASSWTVYNPSANGIGTMAILSYGGAFDGRYVYFAPTQYSNGTYTGEALRYDTAGSFSSVSSWASFNAPANGIGPSQRGYKGAIFDGRYVYFVPWYDPSHGTVLRYDTGTPQPMQSAAALARTQELYVDSTGNLGIGTISPSGKLDVAGAQNFSAYSAPGALVAGTPTSGGSCTAGTHSYKVTFVSLGGETTAGRASNQITCAANETVPLTGIPIGPSGTIARNIYRTVAGDTGDYLLVTTISNNTATTYSDTAADGSLGVAAPTTDTSAVALFQVGGTTRMLITTNGNIGIGTTSPYAKLSVVGETVAQYFTATSTTATSTLAGGLSVAGSSGLTVLQNGNVGIGTTSPGYTLDVSGTGRFISGTMSVIMNEYEDRPLQINGNRVDYVRPFVNNVGSGDSQFSFAAGGNTKWSNGYDSSNGNYVISNDYRLTGYEKLSITTGGNVGIGTTSPGYKLVVSGTAAFPGLTTDNTGFFLCLNSTTGEMATSTTANCTGSSLRFKTNIEDLTYGLNEIVKLKPVFYNWKEDYLLSERDRQVGLIAEDVAGIIPELVGYDKDGLATNVDYSKMTAVLIKAVQELNLKIDNITSPPAPLLGGEGSFWGEVLEWFKDKIVQAKEFIAEKITAKKLCLEDVCIDKEQLKQLLEKNGLVAPIAPTPEPTPAVEPSPPTPLPQGEGESEVGVGEVITSPTETPAEPIVEPAPVPAE